MKESEIEQIRQKLLRLKLELQQLEEISKEASGPVELDQTRVGRVSRMDAMQVQQMAQESARRRRHQLLEIKRALRRIDSGEYGYCSVCEEEIDPRRLSVDPTNTRCIGCVEKDHLEEYNQL